MTASPVAEVDAGAGSGVPWRRGREIVGTAFVIGVLSVFGSAYAAAEWANADFWLYPVMSTRKLTFYYWGQNRLANLVPALAFPFRDPFTNAHVQMFISGAAFVGVTAITHRLLSGSVVDGDRATAPPGMAPGGLHRGEGTTGPVAALSAAVRPIVLLATIGVFLLVVEPNVVYTFFYEQPYGISLACFLLGAVALFGPRPVGFRLIGLALLVAALLVSPTTVVFGGLVVGVALLIGRWRDTALFVVGTAVALVLSVVASTTVGPPAASDLYTKFEPDGAITKWRTAASNIWQSFQYGPLIVVMLISVVTIVAGWERLSPTSRALLWLCPPFAVVWTAVFALNAWVRTNGSPYRYFLPVYLVVLVVVLVAVTLIAQLVVERSPRLVSAAPPVGGAAAALLLAMAVIKWTPLAEYTSMKAVEEPVSYAREHDIRFVGGTYWKTWPAVLALGDSGHEVFGLAERGQAMATEVNAAAQELLAAGRPVRILCIDLEAEWCLQAMAATTGRAWSTERVESEAPLVLEVAPEP